jgi:hypothetical protein
MTSGWQSRAPHYFSQGPRVTELNNSFYPRYLFLATASLHIAGTLYLVTTG